MSNGTQEEKMDSCVFSIPKDRYGHLMKHWDHIHLIVTNGRQINLRVTLEDGIVELMTQPDTPDTGDLARCANFIKAVTLGFSIPVAQIMLHRDNVCIEKLSIKDDLQAKSRSNAKRMYCNISKTKMAIEHFTTTSILMNTSDELYILGSSACVRHAKEYIRHLISLY